MVTTRLVAGPRALRDGPTRTCTRYVAGRRLRSARSVRRNTCRLPPVTRRYTVATCRFVPADAFADVRCVTPPRRNTAICTVLAPAGTEAATVSVEDPVTASARACGAAAATRGAFACPSGTAAGPATLAASVFGGVMTPV